MSKIINNKNQKGFSILAVILVIVAVIVAIGVWALSGQTNTSNTGTSSSDIQASSIINDSAAIKLAFDNLLINGASASSISFLPNVASTSTVPNMLDPTTGIQMPKVNVNAIKDSPASTEGFWVYNRTALYGNNVGNNGLNDNAILLAGVKKSVCERINYNLYGSITIPTTLLANSAATTTGATISDPNTTADPGKPGSSGWMYGCFHASSGGIDDNIFFRIFYVR